MEGRDRVKIRGIDLTGRRAQVAKPNSRGGIIRGRDNTDLFSAGRLKDRLIREKPSCHDKTPCALLHGLKLDLFPVTDDDDAPFLCIIAHNLEEALSLHFAHYNPARPHYRLI